MARARVRLAGLAGDVEALTALRTRLACEIDATTNPWELVAFSPQFVSVVKLLHAITPAAVSKVDEIVERRARRLAAASRALT